MRTLMSPNAWLVAGFFGQNIPKSIGRVLMVACSCYQGWEGRMPLGGPRKAARAFLLAGGVMDAYNHCVPIGLFWSLLSWWFFRLCQAVPLLRVRHPIFSLKFF